LEQAEFLALNATEQIRRYRPRLTEEFARERVWRAQSQDEARRRFLELVSRRG
jgi:hypothetical protein